MKTFFVIGFFKMSAFLCNGCYFMLNDYHDYHAEHKNMMHFLDMNSAMAAYLHALCKCISWSKFYVQFPFPDE